MSELNTSLRIKAHAEGLGDIEKLAERLAQAGINTDKLAAGAKRLQANWEQLSTDEQSAELSKLANQTARLHAMARKQVRLGLDIDPQLPGQLAQMHASLRRFQNELRQGKSGQQAFNQQTQAAAKYLQRLGNSLGNAASGLGRFRLAASSARGGLNLLSSALTGLGVSVGLSELVRLGDEFAQLQARLKLATGDGLAFQSALAGITDIAKQTSSPLAATADLFGNLSRATVDLGLSQSALLDITGSIAKSLQLSGGSADSMNAALTQLTQGLSAGALRGDELNSVMEQSPRLAQALADGLGVGIGQLRAMGAAGELTAEKVIAAMQSQASVINDEFARLPLTVSASMQGLKNELLRFIGTLSDELGTNSALASFIASIGEQLNDLDPKTIDAIKLAFASLGQVAYDVFNLTRELYDSLSALGNSGGEQVGLLTQALQAASVVLGALSDGIAGIKIGFDSVFGGLLVAIGQVREGLGGLVALVNEDLGHAMQSAGRAISRQGAALLNSAHTQALAFESKTASALAAFGKSHGELLQEQAAGLRAHFEAMAKDGKHSSQALQAAFADYARASIAAHGGIIDQTLKAELAQQHLQATISQTGQVSITAAAAAGHAMQNLAGTSERYQDFAQAFAALGLDAEEFATGISQRASTALAAFSQVAQLAGGDVDKLARAYQATQKHIGGSAAATSALNERLSELTGGNDQLTRAVKSYADAQSTAVAQTDAQSAALKALGISMQAVNAGLSQSASALLPHLQAGLVAIKEQAAGAQALKDALGQAFDSATRAAQTVADFRAIDQAIKAAGLSAQLNAEQFKILQAGITGGAAGVKQALSAQAGASATASRATHDLSRATAANTATATANAEATIDNATARSELAKASTQAAAAETAYGRAQSAGAVLVPAMTAQLQQKIEALKQLGATSEQVASVQRNLHQQLQGQSVFSFSQLSQAIGRVNSELDKQINQFNQQAAAVDRATSALQSGAVSADDLARAQGVLQAATRASINGIIRLDGARLDRLRQQINDARARLDDLAASAKTTADTLAAELARLQGDDVRALQIENSKKLEGLEEKLAAARKRNHQGEIAELERALTLQRQINEQKIRRARQTKTAPAEPPPNTSQPTQSLTPPPQTGSADLEQLARHTADLWDVRIRQAESAAVLRFAGQLRQEARRRAS